MIRYHLTIKIYNEFFTKKLDARWKIDSVWFEDYDLFFQKILDDLSYHDLNEFRLNLFNRYKEDIKYCRVSKFENWEVMDWYMIPSYSFNVTSNLIALCLPSRKLRDRYFDYDTFREKYYVKTDFIFYLKK